MAATVERHSFFDLFGLPRELRDRIYGYLPRDGPFTLRRSSHMAPIEMRYYARISCCLVSRQFCMEYRQQIARTMVMHIDLSNHTAGQTRRHRPRPFGSFAYRNVQRLVVHYLGGAYGKLVRTMKGDIVLTSSRIRRFACMSLWKHLACPALRSAARAGASLPQHRGAASCFIRERHRWLLLTSGRLEIRDYTLYDPSESVVQSPPGFAVCRHSNLVPPVLLAITTFPRNWVTYRATLSDESGAWHGLDLEVCEEPDRTADEKHIKEVNELYKYWLAPQWLL